MSNKDEGMKARRTISLLALLIWAVMAAAGCSKAEAPAKAVMAEGDAVIAGIDMDSRAAVITETVVDVHKDPDIKSERITQALYNQPISILEQRGSWYRTKTVDGSQGWIKTRFVDRDISSLCGHKEATFRIVITSREKAVYTHPKAGVTVKDVVMGTVLYGSNVSGTAYEVFLPGNTTGWVRGSGMIVLDRQEAIPSTSGEDFAATVLKLRGVSYLSGGVSAWGIDSAGLVYICAGINGVPLPRMMNGQASVGTPVDTGKIAPGDLLFLSKNGEESPSCLGVFVGDGKFIHADIAKGYVAVNSLEEGNTGYKVASARRIFEH